MEPAAAQLDPRFRTLDTAALVSIAISLKRLADNVELRWVFDPRNPH